MAARTAPYCRQARLLNRFQGQSRVPLLVVLGALAALALGLFTTTQTDVLQHNPRWVPWVDATLTAASLVAQWMMTRKLVENWALWIAVDVVYVPMLAYKGLYAFAVLYAVFLGLAVRGHLDWWRDLRGRPAPSDPVRVAA